MLEIVENLTAIKIAPFWVELSLHKTSHSRYFDARSTVWYSLSYVIEIFFRYYRKLISYYQDFNWRLLTSLSVLLNLIILTSMPLQSSLVSLLSTWFQQSNSHVFVLQCWVYIKSRSALYGQPQGVLDSWQRSLRMVSISLVAANW